MNLVTLSLLLLLSPWHSILNAESDSIQFPEKVYLHIDRDIYNSNDDIWFKAYVINALTNKLSQNTNNLHVELISPASKIIQSRIIRIDSGIGNGDFHFADSLPSGKYRIRAYTNYMRNFDDQYFFTREIIVINPLDGGNELNDSTEYVADKVDISFFPEGGSLVDNVNSVIAFKAVNALGKGCDITGELYSSTGNLVTDFKSTHLGMGTFNLNPASDSGYYAVIKNQYGAKFRAEIPESFPTGVTIHTFITQDKNLLIKVFTNEKTLSSLKNQEMTVSLSSRNLFTKITNIKINSLVNSYLIPVNDFPDGIIRITLSGFEGLPLCERLIYLQKNDDINFVASTDKKIYEPREPVKMNISLTGDTSKSVETYFSFSAVESGFMMDSLNSPASIASWFLLESDVRGPVENSSYYFNGTNERRLKDLDLLLLTQGWRDFQWKYDSTDYFKHEVGFTLSGKVKTILGKKPVYGVKVNIGIFGNRTYTFYIAETDSLGNFFINELDVIGRVRLFASSTAEKDEFKGWIFIDSTSYVPPDAHTKTSEKIELLPDKYKKLKVEGLVILNTRKNYKLSDTINIGEVVIIAEKNDPPQVVKIKSGRLMYGTPDDELIMNPILQTYANIFQVMSGRISGVLVNVSDGSITIRGNIPLILRDGIPSSLDEIASIPIGAIDRIDALKWASSFGHQGANGIINVITKVGENNYSVSPSLKFHSVISSIKGFDAPRIFYSPKYDLPQQSAFTPDTRSTIYWEPNITSETGKDVSLTWFNADKAATIEVNIEGITSEGIPVTGNTYYKVK